MQVTYVAVLLIKISLLCENVRFTCANALVSPGVRDAVENEFSFVVSIGIPNEAYADEKHLCTGALISRRHVLTAAHCFTKTKRERLQVTIGSVNLRSDTAFFSTDWITYAQWAKKDRKCMEHKNNDIAIMKLTEEVSESTIVPAKFWISENENLYWQNATVAGWGNTNDGYTPRILQVGDVRILSNEMGSTFRDVCLLEPKNREINYKYLCAMADGLIHTSSGDSGTPLVYSKDIIVGINLGLCPSNRGLNPNLDVGFINGRRFSIYMSTSFYQEFINHVLEHF